MFVPLHDGVPLRFMRTPYVTYALICICLTAQVMLWFWPGENAELAIMAGFGLIPSVLFGTAQLPEGLAHLPPWLTLFSNILLHANLAHLAGNMLFLWVFGDNVEDAMGHLRFFAFFFLCGLGGSVIHAGMYPDSEQPLIGASGAISGIIASYLMLYPQVRIWGVAFNWIPIHIPALYALGGWILLQAGSAWLQTDGNVGWWAHLGGLATGAALTPLFIHRSVPLFGRRHAEG
ncbi:Rhomboid family intramembrane serine protease [Hyphomicrobiales bacterium]|nr:Rhomboid family intramembrane serine protease [Hyphomicrobiales bacterium]CAH1699052.1 Rhomboid family intramembrane serine protease [Hyphomicrobiales bacterium]CAI0342696.1 Rhomboid family intramembrane serine protease [Hyphomicrobiales bacterium]